MWNTSVLFHVFEFILWAQLHSQSLKQIFDNSVPTVLIFAFNRDPVSKRKCQIYLPLKPIIIIITFSPKAIWCLPIQGGLFLFNWLISLNLYLIHGHEIMCHNHVICHKLLSAFSSTPVTPHPAGRVSTVSHCYDSLFCNLEKAVWVGRIFPLYLTTFLFIYINTNLFNISTCLVI